MLFVLDETQFNLLNERDFNLLTTDEVMYNSTMCYFKNDNTIYDLYVLLGKFLNERCEQFSITYLKYFDFNIVNVDCKAFETYVSKRSFSVLCILKNAEESFYIIYKK